METSEAVLERMTIPEKQRMFAAIAKEFVVAQGAMMIPVRDDVSMIGVFFPFGSKAEIIPADATSAEVDEVRERAKTVDRSISLEEFIARFEQDDQP